MKERISWGRGDDEFAAAVSVRRTDGDHRIALHKIVVFQPRTKIDFLRNIHNPLLQAFQTCLPPFLSLRRAGSGCCRRQSGECSRGSSFGFRTATRDGGQSKPANPAESMSAAGFIFCRGSPEDSDAARYFLRRDKAGHEPSFYICCLSAHPLNEWTTAGVRTGFETVI